MPYVDRDTAGTVVSLYANPQRLDHEYLPDDAPALLPPLTVWKFLRAERDRRLTASDIMVLPDRWDAYTAEQRSAWASYRQSLRDLPEVTVDPGNPAWPEAPEA